MVPFVFVGNKLDLREGNMKDYVSPEAAEQLKIELGAKGAVQCSARNEAKGTDTSGRVDMAFKLAFKYGFEGKRRLALAEPTICCTMF